MADALLKTLGMDALAVEDLRRSRVSSSLCLVDAADSDREEGAGWHAVALHLVVESSLPSCADRLAATPRAASLS